MTADAPLSRAQVEALLESSPMIRSLGIEIVSLDPERQRVQFALPMRAEFERLAGSGQFHGGAIAAFIDTTGDFAVAILVGGAVPTVNIRIDYLRPATGGRLLATATIRRLGRSLAVVDIDVADSQARLVAVGRGTYGTTAA